MRDFRSLMIDLCIVMLAMPQVGWSRELPGEGTLPGQVQKKSAPPTAEKKALASESALPGQQPPRRQIAESRPGPSVQPQPNPQAQPEKPLPGEGALPATMIAQKSSPTIVDQPLLSDDAGIPSPSDTQPDPMPAAAPIGQAPKTFPWLRLNMDGHTGTVRTIGFSRDGSRLFSGGDDKALEVWNHVAVGAAPPKWVHERTVRWQVHRGPRGRIQAIASNADTVAISGHGAMGAMGEILLLDPVTGALKRSLYDENRGHRHPIVSLSFAPHAPILASQDISGRAIAWVQNATTGLWEPKQICASDSEQYGNEKTALIRPLRRLAPLVMVDDKHVVLPILPENFTLKANDRAGGTLRWHLHKINVQTLDHTDLTASVGDRGLQVGFVTALAASSDGKRLVSADLYGNMFFWNLENRVQVDWLQQDVAIISMSIARDRRTLVAGSSISTKRSNTGLIQLWNVDQGSNGKLVQGSVSRDANAVSISPTGDWIAFSQGSSIYIKRPSELATPKVQYMAGRARPALRVAFAAKEPFYRIAFGTNSQPSRGVPLERSFNLENVQLEAAPRFVESDWQDPKAAQGQWRVETVKDATGGGETHWLYLGNSQKAKLPLRTEVHGAPKAVCWIPDQNNAPFAVAVGTSRENLIFVYQLPIKQELVLLRQFRGHEGEIRSLSVSRDKRYLVSSADDCTIRIWNLNDFAKDADTVNRWGAEFEVRDETLVVSAIREDGPLYFRGVRSGDVIHSLKWSRSSKIVEVTQPAEMLKALREADAGQLVLFHFNPGQVAERQFQMFPAWQPLTSIFVAENREWAFWTPAGYYDASFDGHKLFGWQVNPENLATLPEFFLAAQFQQALERPQVMAQLLRTGSLEAAFRAARQAAPGDAENAVLDQYRLKPRVEILSPRPDSVVSNSRTKIQATVTVRNGLQLTPPKAFANGVVANGRRMVSDEAVEGGRKMHFEWDAHLPSDARVVIQVVASTDASVVDTQSVVVRNSKSDAKRQPKLYVVAAGINQYRDAQIQRLDYAVSNARSVVDSLRGNSKSLYTTEATMLLDKQATRPMWSVVTRESADRLRQEAQADDLLVFFLSGHGVRDEETQKYYFVAADARFDDVKAGRFSNCLSFDDFAAFAEVPCRKLVVLDTCHSGAVQQPLRQQDLKAALRALQTDVVFTMTASEGSQEASEEKGKQLGRFTARLLEALSGVADRPEQGGDGDKIVTLNEAFRYVSTAVPADSKGDAQIQHPTVGPIDLIDYAVLPLTAQ